MSSNSIAAQFLTLLIEEYKGLPSLWQVDSEGYKDKNVKRKDYETLLQTLLAVDPLLTMNELKKKIANIRSCYRRERKKIIDSIRSGATGDEVYKPTLWYFNQLDFLRGQEPRPHTVSRLSLDDYEDDKILLQRQTREKLRSSTPTYRTEYVNVRPITNEKIIIMDQDNNILQQSIPIPMEPLDTSPQPTSVPQNRNDKDEANTFSETWAVLFRKLSHEQQLYGKRCIDEVLYQGQLGNLNPDTYRNIETICKCSSDSEGSATTSQKNFINDNDIHEMGDINEMGDMSDMNDINFTNCNTYDLGSARDMSSFIRELCRTSSEI